MEQWNCELWIWNSGSGAVQCALRITVCRSHFMPPPPHRPSADPPPPPLLRWTIPPPHRPSADPPPPARQVDGTPHRVQVTDILDDMVSAFFVDIGDTELVAARSLSPLDAARFGQLAGQALHASLSGVDGERPGAAEALSRLALRKSLICQVGQWAGHLTG